MKKGIIVAIALSVTACSTVGGLGMFHKRTPTIISGDDNQVTLYDSMGVDSEAGQTAAGKYCASYGKTAEFLSTGGDSNDCVSKQMNYCMTYTCK